MTKKLHLSDLLAQQFEIGITSEQVLNILKPLNVGRAETRVIGKDRHGSVVQWRLPGVVLTFNRSKKGGIECYRVTRIDQTEQIKA